MANNNDFDKLNFLGNVAMTLNPPLKDLIIESSYEIERKRKESINFKVVLPSESSYMNKRLIEVNSSESLPDIITNVGFEQIFNKKFIERFIYKGIFKNYNFECKNKVFIKAGCIDPEGVYEIFAATPYVFLIDKNKLGNRPEPKCLEDLLNECYKNEIITNGENGKISYILLLYVFKEFGIEGVIRLKKNVKDMWHGSKMAWNAGKNLEEGGAIYVIPWIFAKACYRKKDIKIIWPEDGAIISPMTMIRKTELREESKDIYNVIKGNKFSNICLNTFYLSAVEEVAAEYKIKWIGWDFVRQNDVNLLRKAIV